MIFVIHAYTLLNVVRQYEMNDAGNTIYTNLIDPDVDNLFDTNSIDKVYYIRYSFFRTPRLRHALHSACAGSIRKTAGQL